jgi:hypothetical protein
MERVGPREREEMTKALERETGAALASQVERPLVSRQAAEEKSRK